MKRKIKFLSLAALGAMIMVSPDLFSQDEKAMQYFREYDKTGINVFESPYEDDTPFNGVYVRVGGGLAVQYQAMWHSNEIPAMYDTAGNYNYLTPISNGFNLPTANLNLDAQLDDGIRLHLRTYLSSRHHNESWVKGGYIQIDKLSRLNSDFVDRLMEPLTIKVGQMEINYGDAHFRRSDNGNALYNPFIGNNIIDAFTTEVAGEIYWRKNGAMVMGGISEGLIKPDIQRPQDNHDPSFYWKLGYDSEAEEGLRWRVTVSGYHAQKSQRNTLMWGDRAGSRFYNVAEPVLSPQRGGGLGGTNSTSQAWSGRWNPGLTNKINTFMINPFIKYNGFEFFGTFEMMEGQRNGEVDQNGEFATRSYTQIVADVLYRFMEDESWYVGAKYATVSGERVVEDEDPITINRIEAGLGWFVTPNVLAKAHYVTQDYVNFQEGEHLYNANFHGFMIEGVIQF